ncbi:hypothetical protein CP973_19375 [Streptomyces albofaciens JCM 4342]|uniref:hypothetical protein n=1 Tax=Streptomyces albofaciens TaxID=66866 RepID=UPI00123956E7|nr:hypothetical protein [Streptomyces albofaciens]KAA6223794.1 hypothetical protein CP973_19375 [Streptomyces albofaciens JCM 4342]
MKFAPTDTGIACDELIGSRPDEALDRIAGQGAEMLDTRGFAVFRLGRLRLSVDESRGLARSLAERLRLALVRRGAPEEMRLEVDRPQETYVPEGYPTRTLLPHFDGQHCSYLTPSVLDMPEWEAAWREFGSRGYTTTSAHKMYQGIFLTDPGQGLSVTTYYDWLAVLRAVREERGLGTTGEPVAEVARWLGGNLREAVRRQPEHGCPYPSMGAMLGLEDTLWHGVSFHHGESDLPKEARERCPHAGPLTQRCPCGRCQGEVARLFCHQTLMSTGMTWDAFKQRWEVLVPGEHCDLLVGHNLTMLHGGLAGGARRVLDPLCLVVDRPAGDVYEKWLARAWRRPAPAGTGAS